MQIKLKKLLSQRNSAVCAFKEGNFPTCNLAYTLLLTSLATVASYERGFSELKPVKTKLCSTLLQGGLETLMIIASESG